MFDIGAALDQQMQALLKNRPTVVFIEPEDPRVVEAAFDLPRFCRPVFLAPRDQVASLIQRELGSVDPSRVEFLLSESAFCPIESRSDLVEEFARTYRDALSKDDRKLKNPPTLEEGRRFASTPAGFGILSVLRGHADLVVGGARHEPRDYFRPLLRFLKTENFACEVGIIILPESHQDGVYPHNLVVLGDVGVNATVHPETLAEIAVNTCVVARDLIPEEVLPKINGAVVSYSNRGADEGPSAELVRKAGALIPRFLNKRIAQNDRYSSISIVSEIKISVALSEKSAHRYPRLHDGDLQKNNVIITPNLDTGNLLFHLFGTLYPDAHRFTIVAGIGQRGVDLPMDVSPADAALAVKGTILRLLRSGNWKRTERDTFFPRPRILAINPGSTSTKVAIYEGEEEIVTEELQHRVEDLAPFEGQSITAQFAFRKAAVLNFLSVHGYRIEDLEAVSARGGLLRPIPHGTYRVNDKMKDDLLAGLGGEHASNLGALIADELVRGTDKPAYITDPVVVDELLDRVRITGLREMKRRAVSHALNQIATCHRYAREHGSFYERLNLIVCHLGGGISIGAHKKGRCVDVNNALDGEGPFTPQRSGSLPVGPLIRLCFSGKYTQDQLLRLNKGKGGLIDLVGTADFRLVEEKALAGETEYAQVFDALCYQVSKWIASMVPAFDGETIDGIILTGGMARSKPLVQRVRSYLGNALPPLTVYGGENEMAALAQGALRVLTGREPAREY
jgi:butyrate kinase